MDLKQKIYDAYSTQVLEHEKEPKSVYLFCKKNKIEETDFYKSFASLEDIKESIFSKFFDNAYMLISKEKGFDAQVPKEKLLSFYFTFFEVLLINRSYVLFILSNSGEKMQKLSSLRRLRNSFKQFASGLIEQGNTSKQSILTKHPELIFSEGAWLQLLFL